MTPNGIKNVFITGACGYVGSVLVPRLLADGYVVTGYDEQYFGDYLPPHRNLRVIKGDIRDGVRLARYLRDADAVIHLACISNDPSVELDESLSRTINFEAFEPMVIAAKAAGVKRFIYASTSSVYGISDAPDVTEDHPLVPITLYNTYKGMCEPLLFKHQSLDFVCSVLRPSTICGYSPRQRLDLAVNILTNLAVNTGVITVYGGKQLRPNLHIEDMVDCYELMLQAPDALIAGETFNVGAANVSIADLAWVVLWRVTKEFPNMHAPTIETTDSVDPRSYQVNSAKIARRLGFRPQRTVEDAVRDLCAAFRNGWLPDSLTDDRYYNVRRMRAIWADLYKDAPALSVDPAKGHLSEIDVMHRSAS